MESTSSPDYTNQHGSGAEAHLDPPQAEAAVPDGANSVASSENSSAFLDESPNLDVPNASQQPNPVQKVSGRSIRGGRFKGTRGNGNDLATHFWRGRGRGFSPRLVTSGEQANQNTEDVARSTVGSNFENIDQQFPVLQCPRSGGNLQNPLQLQFGSFPPFVPTPVFNKPRNQITTDQNTAQDGNFHSSMPTSHTNIREIMEPSENSVSTNIKFIRSTNDINKFNSGNNNNMFSSSFVTARSMA
jgi:hypothetical protein